MWLWQREGGASDRARDEAIDRRALEIMERRRCDWVEAWAHALAEQRRLDGQGDVDSDERAPVRHRTGRAGRVTLSEQIGRAAPGRPGTMAPGRTTRSAALPAAVMRSAERAEIAPEAAALVTRARHGGAPLDDALRSLLEALLGVRLDGVRVHTGADADAASRALGARAFALGDDVFFRDGAYDPQRRDGQRLIAHEVAHTVQARSAATPTSDTLTVSKPGDALEREADAFANEFLLGIYVHQAESADALAARTPPSSPAARGITAASPRPAPHGSPAAGPTTPRVIARDGDGGAPGQVAASLTDDDKKELRELDVKPMAELLTAVEALDPDKRLRYYGHLDEAGIDVKRMRVAFRAGQAKRDGKAARDFAFEDEDMYAMCRSLGSSDQRDAVFQFIEPGFKAPSKREPGSVVNFTDGRQGIIHRGYVKRQKGKNQLPWMCNNPGAVGNGPAFKSPNTYPGKSIGPAAINIYPSEADGMKGLTAWIEFQGRVNNMTFGGFFQAHAPADDGKAGNKGNNPEDYFRRVAAQMGLDPKTSRGTPIATMDASKIADAIRAVGEGYQLGGDVLIWPYNEKELDREVWFAMLYWEDKATGGP